MNNGSDLKTLLKNGKGMAMMLWYASLILQAKKMCHNKKGLSGMYRFYIPVREPGISGMVSIVFSFFAFSCR